MVGNRAGLLVAAGHEKIADQFGHTVFQGMQTEKLTECEHRLRFQRASDPRAEWFKIERLEQRELRERLGRPTVLTLGQRLGESDRGLAIPAVPVSQTEDFGFK